MERVTAELLNSIDKLEPLLLIGNCHTVDFITNNLFERLVPKSIQDEIMGLSDSELTNMVLNSFLNVEYHNKNAPNLSNFLHESNKLSLKQNNICLPFVKFCELMEMRGISYRGFNLIENIMSSKKTHEVEMMSSIVATLAKTEKYSYVVDIGGGKGYLSSVLALKYQLKVLSIDSSFVTSKGAERNIPKVEKLWKINRRRKPSESDVINYKTIGKEQVSSKLCKLATLFITEETNVVELIKEKFEEDDVSDVMLVGLHTCGNLAATSLRMFVNNPQHIRCLVNVCCCYHLIVEEFEAAPHWLLEVQTEETGFGFPMSACLRNIEYKLGHNAMMLAALPPDRILREGTSQSHAEAMFYRSLLEVYLEKKLGSLKDLPNFRVGKIARKCTSFVDYANKSIKRLGLDIQVEEEELQALYDSHALSKQQLHAFFLLRLAIAPAIEGVIMLDRLLYLYEQGIEEAYLTQLFDPVVSPRCFAIVAFNKVPSDGPEEVVR